jgi:hypothetical protein
VDGGFGVGRNEDPYHFGDGVSFVAFNGKEGFPMPKLNDVFDAGRLTYRYIPTTATRREPFVKALSLSLFAYVPIPPLNIDYDTVTIEPDTIWVHIDPRATVGSKGGYTRIVLTQATFCTVECLTQNPSFLIPDYHQPQVPLLLQRGSLILKGIGSPTPAASVIVERSTVTYNPIPEPASFPLAAAGCAALLSARWKRRW